MPTWVSMARLVLDLAAPPAAAQSAGAPGQGTSPEAAQAEEAEVLSLEGQALFKAREFRAAEQKFRQAFVLSPGWLVLWNAARCLEEEGSIQPAATAVAEVLARPDLPGDKRGIVEQKLREPRYRLNWSLPALLPTTGWSSSWWMAS